MRRANSVDNTRPKCGEDRRWMPHSENFGSVDKTRTKCGEDRRGMPHLENFGARDPSRWARKVGISQRQHKWFCVRLGKGGFISDTPRYTGMVKNTKPWERRLANARQTVKYFAQFPKSGAGWRSWKNAEGYGVGKGRREQQESGCSAIFCSRIRWSFYRRSCKRNIFSFLHSHTGHVKRRLWISPQSTRGMACIKKQIVYSCKVTPRRKMVTSWVLRRPMVRR